MTTAPQRSSDGPREPNRPTDRPIDPLDRTRLGLLGGFVATVVMTAFRMPISRSLPPTAAFLSKYVGSDSFEEFGIGAILLHLLYGTVNGGLFGAAFFTTPSEWDVVSEVRGTVLGLTFGLSLSVFGQRIVLQRLLGMDLAPDEGLVFHLGHVVYGLTLGVWMGSRTADR